MPSFASLEALGAAFSWKTKGDFPEPYLSWMIQYGGAVRYRNFFSPVVLLSDPKAIQHVLVTNAIQYPRDPMIEAYVHDHLFGVGLLNSHGVQHDHFRKLLNPLFSAAQVKGIVPMFDHLARTYVKKIAALANDSDSPINISHVFEKMTLEAIGMAAFGMNFADNPIAHDAYGAYKLNPKPWIIMGIVMVPGFLHWPLPELRRRRATQAVLKQVIHDVVGHKLAKLAQRPKANDLLDWILPHSTTAEAICHTMTFLFTGHETSSSALGWVIATLTKHPASVARIRTEVAAVMASHGGLTSWDALNALKFTLAVIQETLRVHTAVFALLPKLLVGADDHGTHIEVHPAILHRNPKYWAHPTEFVPDRFLQGTPAWHADLALRDGKPHTFIYMPFSVGAKNCIGQRFAMAEMQIIVALFTRHFDFALTPLVDLRPSYNGATIQPSNLEVTVRTVDVPVA
ncbi:Aste57867_23373 [Aphanomyces stellatus]|uniref:Aste57867_23373 protein n=1 Tax=Aphanomyces stellatus TaxID=120398 RepID=A0A485LPE2_9STRA|nr:hypothetical protein As57867_023302 [Aphanomyces stellatus]VFU00019.1 Aste57867_23373 [Aphanomyces stellatus]